MIEIRITDNEAEQRLDRFLRKYLKEYSLGDIYKLFRKNKVKVNNKKVKENYMLSMDDIVKLYINDVVAETNNNKINNIHSSKPIEIVYEDENILLINKPIGILTHPDKSEDNDTIIGRALHYLINTDNRVESVTFTPSVCNRLDRNTGGIVIIAKNYKTLKAVNQLIRERKIRKLYICIVKGRVIKDGEIKNFLVKAEAENKVRITKQSEEGAKEVHTVYKVIKVSKEYSLLEVELITGRSHQIRAHFADMGHPLIGDIKYGDSATNNLFKGKYNLKHQFLYAYRIEFEECSTDLKYLEGKSFTCKLPEYMEYIIEQLFR